MPHKKRKAPQIAARAPSTNHRRETLDSFASSPAQARDITIAIIPKSAGQQLHVTLRPWPGAGLLDLRIHERNLLGGHTWTREGAALAVEKPPELIAALQRAEIAARAMGLLA